jgi:phosphoribosylformimino-5-aminoimidazole carboxamide ribotide isomerase
MLIIPAIDLIGGKCVRLTQGDYARETIYDDDPAAVAARFDAAGVEWIHVVDLDGAKAGGPCNLSAIRCVIEAVRAKVEVGGGVRSLDTAHTLLDMGVGRVIVGTKLVQDPQMAERFLRELGEQVVAGIDARSGKVAVAGWTEGSETTAVDLARRVESQGARRVILTDIARDGALVGPNVDLLTHVASAVRIPVVASGGISRIEDLEALLPTERLGVEGVIVGKAIYEGRLDLAEALRTVAQCTAQSDTVAHGDV